MKKRIYLATGAQSQGGSTQQTRVAGNPPENVPAGDNTTSQGGQEFNPNLQTVATQAQDAIDSTMTAENAIAILNSRKLITEPGKYQCKVTNVTPYEREDSGILTAIINYNAMTPYQLSEAKRLFKEGDYQGATNQNLSSSQRIGIDYVPMKSEIVDVVCNIIPTKNRPEGALLVEGCQPLRTKQTTNVHFSLNDIEDENLNRPGPIDMASVAEENRRRSIERAQERGGVAVQAEPSLAGEVEQPAQV